MSHAAYTATIRSALSVARTSGQERVVMTAGSRSERYARYLWPSLTEEAFVPIGKYFNFSLKAAAAIGFKKLSLVVFFAEAVKMSQGVAHAHAAKALLSLGPLAQWVKETCDQTGLAVEVEKANSARQAFDLIRIRCPGVIERVGQEIINTVRRYSGPKIRLQCILLDYEGRIIFDSDAARGGGMRL
jgi:cobalt-precorrin-5B (C1)-methyltransferase